MLPERGKEICQWLFLVILFWTLGEFFFVGIHSSSSIWEMYTKKLWETQQYSSLHRVSYFTLWKTVLITSVHDWNKKSISYISCTCPSEPRAMYKREIKYYLLQLFQLFIKYVYTFKSFWRPVSAIFREHFSSLHFPSVLKGGETLYQ